MRENLLGYAAALAEGRLDPCFDGRRTQGLLVDADRAEVPLSLLRLYRWELERGGCCELETGAREMVLVPQWGTFRVGVNDERFRLDRPGGAFDPYPGGESNASALYVPRDAALEVQGQGEIIGYSAPAERVLAPELVLAGEAEARSCGVAHWRRDETVLVRAGEVSDRLIVGETYLPAGHWSETPAQTHDGEGGAPALPGAGAGSPESDHEAVHYHRCRMAGDELDPFAHAVQLLLWGARLRRAYLVHDSLAVAIPGGGRPVAAAPVSDHLYGWALASRPGAERRLSAVDIEVYDFLRPLERFLAGVELEMVRGQVSRANLRALLRQHGLGDVEGSVLVGTLLERGFEIVGD